MIETKWWSREGRTPDLRIANGLDHHCMVLSCSDVQWHKLQFFNRLQPSEGPFLVQSFDMDFHRFAESRVTNR